MMHLHGKTARLPLAVREALNQRIINPLEKTSRRVPSWLSAEEQIRRGLVK